MELRRPNRSWRVDETYIKIAGKSILLARRSIPVLAEAGFDGGEGIPALGAVGQSRPKSARDHCRRTQHMPAQMAI
jgi:hypothetical protein